MNQNIELNDDNIELMEMFNIHGSYLFPTYGILTLVLISSQRYLKPFKRIGMIIHAVTGIVILLSTL